MIRTRADLRRYLAEDLHAHGLERWRPHCHITRPVVAYQRLLRRTEYHVNRRPLGSRTAGLYRVRLRRAGHRLGFTIPPNVFGPGLRLAHAGTIVVNGRARVGRDFTISQGCTIGEANGHYPQIGDGCHMAPNSCVIGGITLGDRVGVWCGAVVTKDVPSDTSVAGVPAKPMPRKPPRPVLVPTHPVLAMRPPADVRHPRSVA